MQAGGTTQVEPTRRARQSEVTAFYKYCSLTLNSAGALELHDLGSNSGFPIYSCRSVSKIFSFIFLT